MYLFLVLFAGFSRQIVQILKDHSVQYSSFDILSDEEVRQGLKTYSNWPTYPQVYVNGDLIGGLDILKVRGVTVTLTISIAFNENQSIAVSFRYFRVLPNTSFPHCLMLCVLSRVYSVKCWHFRTFDGVCVLS